MSPFRNGDLTNLGAGLVGILMILILIGAA